MEARVITEERSEGAFGFCCVSVEGFGGWGVQQREPSGKNLASLRKRSKVAVFTTKVGIA